MKKLLWLFLILFALAWCNMVHVKKDVSINESIIKENLNKKTWYLNLSNKGYDKIPDFCNNTVLNANIKIIDFSHNNIKKVDQDLTCLNNLEVIDFSYNDIDNFINLWKPRFLHTINLQNNKISNLGNLSKYKNIAHLNLDYNNIKSLNFLKNLKDLRVLGLQHNNISNLSWLDNFNQILSIDLSYNNISDKYQLKYLKNLHTLRKLYLKWNPLDKNIINKIEDWSNSNN